MDPDPADALERFDTSFMAAAYRDHGRVVYRFVARLGGAELAEDVTQDVFLALWQHPGRFDPARGALRTWLLTAARSRMIDVLRSDTSRRNREDSVQRSAVPATTESADAQVVLDDEVTQLRAGLEQLPAAEREAIVTAFYGEVSYRQAALILGEAEGTTKSRVRSGLRRLASGHPHPTVPPS